MRRIDIASVDDWEALYVDGEKYAEGHSIGSDVYLGLLTQLGVEVNTDHVESKRAYDLAGAYGRFPDDISDFTETA